MSYWTTVFDAATGGNPARVELPAGSYVKLDFKFPPMIAPEIVRSVYASKLGTWYERDGHSFYVDSVDVDGRVGIVSIYGIVGGSALLIVVGIALVALSIWGMVFGLSKAHVLAEDVTHSPVLGIGTIGAVIIGIFILVLALMISRQATRGS